MIDYLHRSQPDGVEVVTEMKMAFATPVELDEESQNIPVVNVTEMTEMDRQLPVAREIVTYAHGKLPHAQEVKSSDAHDMKSSAPQIPPLPTDQGKTTNEASTQETKQNNCLIVA